MKDILIIENSECEVITEILDRTTIEEQLKTQWAAYVQKFKAMNPEQQEVFLKQQGYQRLADLLAHFSAWWKVGMQVIEKHRVDPSFVYPEVDVDAFNASAVEKVRDFGEDEVIVDFNETRLAFLDLLERLSDMELQNPKIARQLEIELFMHYEEHRID